MVGALPFDDDNLRNLLEKVKKGVFHIPHFVPPDCQHLLRSMVEVDANKRITLDGIHKHAWVIQDTDNPDPCLEPPMAQVVQTCIIPTEGDLDPDVLGTMTSLQCFKDRPKLVKDLLSSVHNTEKVIYFLLLDRKLRNPSLDDEDSIKNKSIAADPPRKRVDSRALVMNGRQSPRLSLGDITEGSPQMSRRALAVQRIRKNSLTSNAKSPNASPTHSLRSTTRQQHLRTRPVNVSPASTPPSSPSPGPSSPAWKTRLHTIKNSFLGSPRFHRRKIPVPSDLDNQVAATPDSSPELSKRSWFGSLVGSSDKEDIHINMIVQERTLNQIKADLVHAFLTTPDLNHSVITPTSFRAEYRRSGGTSSMFSRNVKFQVDITCPQGSKDLHYHRVVFTLISGPARRFKRLCELLQSVINNARIQHRKINSDLGSLSSNNESTSSYLSERGASCVMSHSQTPSGREIEVADEVFANGKND